MKEIIIIETANPEKIKNLLDQNKIDYEIVYRDTTSLTEAEIIARIDNENSEEGNIGLPENPTLEERTKYKLCKSILTYQLKNKLSSQQVAKKLNISEEELYDICRGKINDFSVVRLMSYLEKLIPDYELAVVNREQTESERKRNN